MRPGRELERASPTEKRAAILILALGILYLLPFVNRGWVPLDEGMIGQAAERVLNGGLPHVDYEEPYPGALSYFYALVFKTSGIDSVHLRWTVFASAVASMAIIFILLRRYLAPLASAAGVWVALVWTFPNYFSSLPSWWILLAALACIWSLVRYIETQRLLYAALAGVAAGAAFCIKQTGLFLFPPLTMALLIVGRNPASRASRIDSLWRTALAVCGFAFVILITRSHAGSSEIVYLIAPVAASCAAFYLLDTLEDLPAAVELQRCAGSHRRCRYTARALRRTIEAAGLACGTSRICSPNWCVEGARLSARKSL